MTQNIIPRDPINGRFLKGNHYSLGTEFKKDEHWREHKLYWDKNWLYNEYIVNEKSMSQIAQENNCTENNISYFIRKFDIQTRTMSEIRKDKYWGLSGEQNGMYGCYGENNPNWKGGITAERQSLYASSDWKCVVSKIWNRDNATCVRCNTHQNYDIQMHIHHIVSFSVVDMRTELNNLVLLCKKCHNYIHSNENKNGEFLACPLI